MMTDNAAAVAGETHLNAIPPMTDPLGQHWRQPSGLREALMDETHVLLTSAQISGLMEYSGTLPTGVYPGKCWQRFDGKFSRSPEPLPVRHLLVWYGDETADRTCPVIFREILVLL